MDQFFKDNLKDFRAKPDKSVWEKIENDLDTIDFNKKMLKHTRFYRYSIAVLLLLLGTQSVYLFHQNNLLNESYPTIQHSTNIHTESQKFIKNYSALINKLTFYNNQTLISSGSQSEETSNQYLSDYNLNGEILSNSDVTSYTTSSREPYRPSSSIAVTKEEEHKITTALNAGENDFFLPKSSLLSDVDLLLLSADSIDHFKNAEFLASIKKLVDNPFELHLGDENRRIRKLRSGAPARYAEGIHFGVGIQIVRNSINEINQYFAAEKEIQYSFNSGSGLKYGFNYGYDFNSNFGIESGFYLNTLNYSMDVKTENWKYSDRNFRLDYLELPLLFRFKMSGYSYALDQTHGVTFTAGVLYKKLIGGIFEETKHIFNESQYFQKHNYGFAGGIQYDIFLANSLILGFNTRFDISAPINNRHLYNTNFSGGASLRYFIPTK